MGCLGFGSFGSQGSAERFVSDFSVCFIVLLVVGLFEMGGCLGLFGWQFQKTAVFHWFIVICFG